MESQIAQWRAYVAKAPAVDGRDVDELEAHLRDQIAELDAAHLTADEAFLVAVKRMGDLDDLSREFAREHSGRLWKQLVLSGEDEPARPSGGWLEALGFALAAAVAIQVPHPTPQQEVASYTISTAQQSGWIWDIGLVGRSGVAISSANTIGSPRGAIL